MTTFQASVLVRLKKSVLDPAGEAAKSASQKLGVEGIKNLRIGKIVEIEFDAKDEKDAKQKVELLGDRLFANPVIEEWSLSMVSSESDKPS